MKIRRVDIIDDVLIDEIALHYIGQTLFDYLDKELSKHKTSTTFIIDITKANPIDYKFCEIAFGKFYTDSINNEELDFIFKSDKYNLRELITGILEYLKIRSSSDTNNEIDVFKENNLYLKYMNENNDLEYISNLSEDHYRVLNYINNKRTITSNEIQKSITKTPEKTTSILNSLVKAKFVIREKESIYSSIKININNGK